jgi:predicted metalloprotease
VTGQRWPPILRCMSLFAIVQLVILMVHDFEASAQTPTPTSAGFRTGEASGFAGEYGDLYDEFDAYWRREFSMLSMRYVTPVITEVRSSTSTGCGRMSPNVDNAIYCPPSQEIILFPQYMAAKEREIGDYAPILIVAHEWAHHAQNMAGIPDPGGNFYELQADCLAGVFSQHAEDQGWLEPGDVIEALELAESVGDSPLFPQDSPGAHGTYADRRKSVMRGMLDGLPGCNFPNSDGARPTQTPTRNTPTEVPTRIPPTPTPTAENLPAPRLPNVLPLAHASCFDVVGGAPLTFTQLLDRFSGFPDASTRLQVWGWQASAYRQFGCDGPPEGDAGWIDISVHGFASAESAREAADYFAAARLDGSSLRRADGPGVGDYSIALGGPASNGTEFTIYATRGPWLVRVTGVSPSGIPFMNVRTVANDVLEAQDLGGVTSAPTVTNAPASSPSRPSEAYLPNSPSLNYAACFRTHSSGTISYGDVREAFARTSAGAEAADTYGWQDGAWVVFICDDAPYGHARQLDVIIHQFLDGSAAQQVASTVKAFQIPGDHESRACDTADALVICVTGYADTGSPLSDVYFVLNQVVSGAR